MQRHAFAVVVERIGRYLAHLQAAEEDGRAHIERAHVLALEYELTARHAGGEYGRRLEADEISAFFCLRADVDPHVRAR